MPLALPFIVSTFLFRYVTITICGMLWQLLHTPQHYYVSGSIYSFTRSAHVKLERSVITNWVLKSLGEPRITQDDSRQERKSGKKCSLANPKSIATQRTLQHFNKTYSQNRELDCFGCWRKADCRLSMVTESDEAEIQNADRMTGWERFKMCWTPRSWKSQSVRNSRQIQEEFGIWKTSIASMPSGWSPAPGNCGDCGSCASGRNQRGCLGQRMFAETTDTMGRESWE